MNKLTLKIEFNNLNNIELKNYLLNLKGIKSVINDNKDDELITIEYDNNITLYIVVKEILLYLEIEMPYIIYFNKYLKGNLDKYTITIENLCCEYCLKNKIEELLYIDGISEVYSDFDNDNKKDVQIYINYDKDKITEKELIKISRKFNEY